MGSRSARRGRWVVLGALAGVVVWGAGAIIATAVLTRTSYRDYVMPSASMEPTFTVGTHMVVERGAQIRNGDVIVFRGAPFDGAPSKSDYVKRVIASGGEKVACCTAGVVTRDGVKLVEPYIAPDTSTDAFREFPTTTVPAGRYWVMGDNRSNSSDSRFHRNDAHQGTIGEQDVIGRVVAHGSIFTAYGYVVKRAVLLALPTGLIAGVVTAILLRRRASRSVHPDAFWASGGTMEGP